MVRFIICNNSTRRRSFRRHFARCKGAACIMEWFVGQARIVTFKSESKDCPKREATERRPSLPSPSLSSQFIVAAAGNWLCAPTPTAASNAYIKLSSCLTLPDCVEIQAWWTYNFLVAEIWSKAFIFEVSTKVSSQTIQIYEHCKGFLL